MNSASSFQLPSIDVFAYPARKTYEQLQLEIQQLQMALQHAQSRETQLVQCAKARINELNVANMGLRSKLQQAEIENVDLKMRATHISLELARKDALLEEVTAENLELMSQRQMEDNEPPAAFVERFDCATQTVTDNESSIGTAEDTFSSSGGAMCDAAAFEAESVIYEPLTPPSSPSLEASNSSFYSDGSTASGFPSFNYFSILTLPEGSF